MTISRSEADPVILIVAAIILDEAGRILLARKQGTSFFMLPGGKPDPGESPIEALERELVEELGVACVVAPDLIGQFTAPAANEPGHRVDARIFYARLAGEPAACAEIAELAWHDPQIEPAFPLAPLARDHVLPAVRAQLRAA